MTIIGVVIDSFVNYKGPYKGSGKNICMECIKYRDVAATLTGKLKVGTVPADTTKDQSGSVQDFRRPLILI